MPIIYHENSRTFHLHNNKMSHIFKLIDGYPVTLYTGKAVHDQEEFDCLFETSARSMSVTFDEERPDYSFAPELSWLQTKTVPAGFLPKDTLILLVQSGISFSMTGIIVMNLDLN